MSELRDFKFMTKLVLEFEKLECDDESKYNIFYSNLKVGAIVNETDIDDVLESIYVTIISTIQKSFVKGSGWTIVSVTLSIFQSAVL